MADKTFGPDEFGRYRDADFTQQAGRAKRPGAPVPPAHEVEARPRDMAIWRAILAGEEWIAYTANPAKERRAFRWHCGHGGAGRAKRRSGVWRYFMPENLDVLRLHLTWACGRMTPTARRSFNPKIVRLVLFTHPFTGGRAVYSEVIE